MAMFVNRARVANLDNLKPNPMAKTICGAGSAHNYSRIA